MLNIRTNLYYTNQFFKDPSALGNFIDNHDNPRFLYFNPSVALLKSAVVYAMFAQGIPIMYYGTEQLFNGGFDPADREALWTHMNADTDMYKYFKTINTARKAHSIWKEAHVERWADDKFYAWTRGNVLITVTNDDSGADQKRLITYHPFKSGQKLCNVLFSGDCITIGSDNAIPVTLLHGEAKVFVPQ